MGTPSTWWVTVAEIYHHEYPPYHQRVLSQAPFHKRVAHLNLHLTTSKTELHFMSPSVNLPQWLGEGRHGDMSEFAFRTSWVWKFLLRSTIWSKIDTNIFLFGFIFYFISAFYTFLLPFPLSFSSHIPYFFSFLLFISFHFSVYLPELSCWTNVNKKCQ